MNYPIVIYSITENQRVYYIQNNSLLINDYHNFDNTFNIDNYKNDNYKLYYSNDPKDKENYYSYNKALNTVKEKVILNEVNTFLTRFSNPFTLSLDNKRYYSFDCYCKRNFGKKIVKIPVDGPFSCPNRDGSISNNGCVFCYLGSSAFPNLNNSDLLAQYYNRKSIYDNKWQNYIPYAYFQSYSNSYGSLSLLKEVYEPFMLEEDVKGIVVSTRSDCLDKEKIAYFNTLSKYKPIWIELGLQSTFDNTLQEMNRGHDFNNFLEAINMLDNTNLTISVHLINGWPTETIDMMLENVKIVGKLNIQAVKFHMLHVCRNTPLGKYYLDNPFPLLSKEEYCKLVANQLCFLKEDTIIERLTGDALANVLIQPDWTIKKVSVINDIDKYMSLNNLFQGKNY